MKKLILSLIAFTTLALSAQDKIQWSAVREQNSNKRPIPNAQVIFSDAPPASSDQNGKLRLAFKDKKPGAYVFLTEVQKAGYEVVNNKEIEQVKIGEGDQLGVNIILAKVGIVDAAKKEYYGISDKSLKAGFEREKAKLRGDLQASRVTAEQFEKEKAQLEKEYERQQKELDALADKFARVNFDDVSAVYKEALESFKAGKIDEAITKLESVNPTKRTEAIIKEQKRIANAQAELDSQKVALEKEKRQQIANLRLLADMYSLKFDPIKAEAQYDDLLRLDSTDLEILIDAADFYLNNHHYNKALPIYPLIIAHPQAEAWQVANANNQLGDLFTSTGYTTAALNAYTKYYEGYHQLLQKDPEYSFYKYNLSICYNKLGLTNIFLGNLDKALTFYEKEFELSKELFESYPQNADFKNSLAISYEKLGSTYSKLGNLEKALAFFEQCNSLSKELYDAYSQNVNFKNELAISYYELGTTHSELGNLEKALTFFEARNRLSKELYEAYPQNVDFKNELAISYYKLGTTHSELGNLEKALTFFEARNRLSKELYETYPQNVDFKHGLAISYQALGITYNSLGNLEKTLVFFEQYYLLEKELYEIFPQNVDFKNVLAIACSKLGATYSSLGNLEKALIFFEQYNSLEKELHDAYPKNVLFKNELANSYSLLVETYSSASNLEKALVLAELTIKLSKELYETYPQNVDFKYGLANSYEALGTTHSSLGNLEKALIFFEQYNSLSKELYDAYPKNVLFKYGSAASYERLGIIHSSLGNLEKALTFFEQFNSLEKELYEAYPQNVNFKNGLAISYSKLGKTYSSLGNLEKALIFFKQYNLLEKELYDAHPQNVDFKNTLAISYSQLGSFYKDQIKDIAKAKSYSQKCYDIWKELSVKYPENQEFKNNFQWAEDILLNTEDTTDIVNALNRKIQNEIDTNIIYRLYNELCDSLRRRASLDPQHKPALAEALNSLAWYGFFLKKFEPVEKAIRDGLALNTDNKFLHTNFAPALLFQGKLGLALKEYQKWKDQAFGEPNLPTYREAFLADLEAFEKAGIIPPKRKADVEAVRKLLNEPKKK